MLHKHRPCPRHRFRRPASNWTHFPKWHSEEPHSSGENLPMLSNIHARDREKVAIDQRPQKRKTLLSGLAPLVLAIWFLSTPDQTLEAQQRSVRYPGDIYYSGFANYYRGDLRDAAKIFDRARATGYRGATSRWVDSVCYHTMMGECLYQLGEIDAALVQYDNALSYVLAESS